MLGLVGKYLHPFTVLIGTSNGWTGQLFTRQSWPSSPVKDFSPSCCFGWWFALSQTCFPHPSHTYGFRPGCVSWCSAKHKISFKTKPHVSQRWAFWVEGPDLGVLTCDTPFIETHCSKGISSFSIPCQQPKSRQMLVKHKLTLVGEGSLIANMCLTTKCKIIGMLPRQEAELKLSKGLLYSRWHLKVTEGNGLD